MQIAVKEKPLLETGAEAVLVLLTESESAGKDAASKAELPPATAEVDAVIGGVIAKAAKRDPRAGKPGFVQIVYPAATGKGIPERVVVAGVGKLSALTPERVRLAWGPAVRLADGAGVKSLAFAAVEGVDEGSTARHTQAACEAALLTTYHFGEFKKRTEGGHLADVFVTAAKGSSGPAKEGVRRGTATGKAQNLARMLAELPGGSLWPEKYAEKAVELGRAAGLTVEVHDEKKLAKLGMHAILSVGRGSRRPPRLVVFEHLKGRKGAAPLVLVGKGITFDSGGISLKEATPSNSGGSIDLMRIDKSGACSVLAAMVAIAELGVKANVVGVAALAENMPDGDAYRPGDVIGSYRGRTIEIMSTDAEGRLVLADALAWSADRWKPAAMVNVATLTGACSVALGEHNAGLFSNDDALAARITAAAEFAGEPVWRMPLQEPYREQTRSKIADLMNSGGRPGGACTAAAFLWEFAGTTPWAHLDIAGVMHSGKDKAYLPRGATAYATRTLIELAESSAG